MEENVFDKLSDNISAGILSAMRDVGTEICEGMRDRLQAAGHVDTGELLNSIRSETEESGEEVTTTIYAAKHADYIENGTGAAHGRPGGRVGYWRYKDRNGNWHTTDGMDADPFIAPAVGEVMENLSETVKEAIKSIVNI